MTRTCFPTDQMLLERWRAGDALAGDALLARHTPALTRFLRRRAGSDADDILQSTLLACTESLVCFRGEATFRTYAFTIARHELQRFYRERARRQRQVDPESADLVDGSSPLATLTQRRLHDALAVALSRLSAAERALLRQFYADELDSGALASVHGLKPVSVRARLHRARRSLARELQLLGWEAVPRCDVDHGAIGQRAPRTRVAA